MCVCRENRSTSAFGESSNGVLEFVGAMREITSNLLSCLFGCIMFCTVFFGSSKTVWDGALLNADG